MSVAPWERLDTGIQSDTMHASLRPRLLLALLTCSLLLWGCGDTGGGGASAVNVVAGTGGGGASTLNMDGGDMGDGAGGSDIVAPAVVDAPDIGECEGGCEEGLFCASSGTCLTIGNCASEADCGEGQVCNDTGTCEIGGECGQQELSGERRPPNILILLDRSGSMDGDAQGDSRWNVARSAIRAVTERFDDELRFGLATYSACLAGGCSAGSVVVPIAGSNAASINGFLANKVDRGSDDGRGQDGGDVLYLCDSGDPETSTGKSLNALVGEPSLQAMDRESAVLLITDGEESGACIDDEVDGRAGAAALLGQATPVRTYVVGLGINNDEIDGIAAAGGTGSQLSAENQQQLVDALASIATDVVSCALSLDEDPPDSEALFVFFNDEPTPIAQDGDDGWTYEEGTRTVLFHGSACDGIQGGSTTDIDVVFGCGAPVIQ